MRALSSVFGAFSDDLFRAFTSWSWLYFLGELQSHGVCVRAKVPGTPLAKVGLLTQLSSCHLPLDSVPVALMAAAWLAPSHTPQEAHCVCLAQDLRAFLELKGRPWGRDLRSL